MNGLELAIGAGLVAGLLTLAYGLGVRSARALRRYELGWQRDHARAIAAELDRDFGRGWRKAHPKVAGLVHGLEAYATGELGDEP